MKRMNILQLCMMIMLALPLANAASISINAPDYLTESESTTINLSISSEQSFNGSVHLTYTNINSNIPLVVFADSSFSGEFYNYSWSITGISSGAYSIFANLTDSAGITMDSLNKTGSVIGPAPKIISALPSGFISKDSTVLIASTNEAATCKYDTADNNYGSLSNVFSITGDVYHNQTITSLSNGEHKYYVRCQDANGNIMNESAIIKFNVDLLPNAQILLSDSSPVKQGTIEVTVLSSENLENAPILEYSFNDAPSARNQISLTGSNSLWKGYLIITELDDNKVGTFYFTATDGAGNAGTRITNGNLFVVDTKKPVAPQSIKAVPQDDGSIKIIWYYDGEEENYFNIYRSTMSGINYVDFYAVSNGSQQFTDRSAIDKATYYYKVSAVDKANNEGPLSEEVFATSVNKFIADSSSSTLSSEVNVVPKVLPPNLVPRVDIFIKKIDKLLIDVKDTLSQLEKKEGDKKEVIKELMLEEQVSALNSKLESLKEQLEGFKSAYATEEELEQKLSAIDLEAKKIEKTTPKDVEILEKSEFLQSIGKEDIQQATNELFKDVTFTQDEKDAYVRKNVKEKDKVKVEVSVKVISIIFLDGTKSEKSLIKKKLSYQDSETLSDVIAIESIPKTIAESINEIEFPNQKYEVINEDPIAKFGFLKFSFEGVEIYYTLDKKIPIEEAKNAKTVVLLNLNEIVGISNKVTGASIFSFGSLGLSSTQTILIWIGVLAIIGLTGYYMLFVKDYKYAFKKWGRALKLKRIERSLDARQKEFADSQYPADENPQRANKIKAGSAGKMLPLIASLNDNPESNMYKKSGNSEHDVVFVNALINQAHSHINNSMHIEAVKLYPKICLMYQNLPKETKLQVYEECMNLQKRINNLKPIL